MNYIFDKLKQIFQKIEPKLYVFHLSVITCVVLSSWVLVRRARSGTSCIYKSFEPCSCSVTTRSFPSSMAPVGPCTRWRMCTHPICTARPNLLYSTRSFPTGLWKVLKGYSNSLNTYYWLFDFNIVLPISGIVQSENYGLKKRTWHNFTATCVGYKNILICET